MIIDFRLRPATRGFLNMHIFRNQERIASWSGKLGMVPPPSAKQGDMELMLKEMEEGGVTLGVVPGRQANAFMGNVPNEDIAAIVAGKIHRRRRDRSDEPRQGAGGDRAFRGERAAQGRGHGARRAGQPHVCR